MNSNLNRSLCLWLYENRQDELGEIYNDLLHEAKRIAHARNLVCYTGEDLLHDTLIALHKKRDTIKEPLHYFRVVISNKAKDALQKETDHQTYDEYDLYTITSTNDVESEVFASNDHADLEALQSLSIAKCLAKLTPIQQEALTLSVFEQRRNVDIARILGINEKAAAKRVSDSKESFRRYYEPEI